MDVNYYLHREQVERFRADQAAATSAGHAHRKLADLYRERIQSYRVSARVPTPSERAH
jgi:hypothetical protein